MKKILAVILLLSIIALSFTACSEKKQETEDEKPVSSQEDKNDSRDTKYSEEWIDKSKAEEYKAALSPDLSIEEIYSDCFIATYMIPMPYKLKINGKLSDEWCVGDKVYVEFENAFIDEQTDKIEADLVNIKETDFELDPVVAYKPVIYLYPEKKTDISVKLNLDGKLTCTYPKYNGGWQVTANPDGTLTDKEDKEYNYLYWEGETNACWDFSNGFCVKGENTALFLENALEKLGLNRREANEFIVYWLPLMETNPYNIISFQAEAYTNAAELEINPKPDTLIRVFMTYKASDSFVEIKEQKLTAPTRRGFTAVEWGGSEVK